MASDSTLRELGLILDRLAFGEYVSPADRIAYQIRANLASRSGEWPKVGHRDERGNRPRALFRAVWAHRTGQLRRFDKKNGFNVWDSSKKVA